MFETDFGSTSNPTFIALVNDGRSMRQSKVDGQLEDSQWTAKVDGLVDKK